MRARELEKMLLEDGWYVKNQKGSHRQYKHPSKPGKVTIPFHTGDVDKGTASSVPPYNYIIHTMRIVCIM